MAIAGALEIQLTAGIARLQSDLNNVNRIVGSSMKKVEGAVDSAKRALAGLGVGLTVAAFAAYIKSTIDAADKLNDLRIRSGLTGQELLILEGAAVRGGASLDSISDVTSKLSKRLGAAEIGSGEAAKALAAMGMSATTAGGQTKSVSEIMREAGERFALYEDGADKAALATALFGKGGDKLIPVIEGIKETEERFKRLGITIDEDVITAADKFNDTMQDIKALSDVFARSLVTLLLPYLQQLAEAMIEFKRQGNDAGTMLKAIVIVTKIAAVGFIGLYTAIAAASEILAGLALANAAFYSGNWSLVGPSIADGWDKAGARLKAYAGLVTALDPFGGSAPGGIANMGGTEEKEKRGNAPKLPDLKGAEAIAKAKLAFELELIKREADAMANAYANQQHIIDAQRAAGLIEENQYYEEKRISAALNVKVQEDALLQEINLLKQQKLIGKDKIDNDRAILKLRAEFEKLIANTVTSERVLAIEQTASLVKVKQAYVEADAAANEYLLTLRKSQAVQLAGMGIGDQERNRLSGRAQIDDKYTSDLRQLEVARKVAMQAGPLGPDAEKKFAEDLARIQNFQATALSEYDMYFARRLQQESDWTVGAAEAMKNYYDESRNVAKQTETLFTNSFKSIEDALVQFTQTGKLDFKSLVNSINAELTRISIKKSLGMLSGELTSGGGLIGDIGRAFGLGGRSSVGNAGGGMEGLSSEAGDAFSALNTAGAAHGADWMVGGSGGTDSKLARFRVTPGERVIVQTPEQQAQVGGGMSVTNIFNIQGQMNKASQAQVAAAAYRGVTAAALRNS